MDTKDTKETKETKETNESNYIMNDRGISPSFGSVLPSKKDPPPKKQKPWRELTRKGKIIRVSVIIGIFLIVVFLLFTFFSSVSLISTSFKIIVGEKTTKIFSFAKNPMAGLCVGILITALFQSSSTTTSLVVAMVASKSLTVKMAVPVIMGANIGTSVTNTIVSIGHAQEKEAFRRATEGATIHDFFNILVVLTLMPLELIPFYKGKGVLELLSYFIVLPIPENSGDNFFSKINFVKKSSTPIVNFFIKPEYCLIKMLQKDESLRSKPIEFFSTCVSLCSQLCTDGLQKCSNCLYKNHSFIKGGILKSTHFNHTWSAVIGVIISFITMSVSLMLISKTMSKSLRNQTSTWIKHALLRSPIISILLGCAITFVVQSSSITTSTLVPLVALKVITLEQMFPLTIGANIGTTITSLVAGLSEAEKEGLQIAFCHLLFNLAGLLIFYPIPFLRNIPIFAAKALGYRVSKKRIYGLAYTLITFAVIPLSLFGLSFIPYGALVGAIILYGTLIFVYIWRQIRIRRPDIIPLWCPSIMQPNESEKEETESDKETTLSIEASVHIGEKPN